MDRFKFRVWDKETNKYYKSKISNSSVSVIYQHPSSNSCSWVGINTLFADLEKDEENNKQTKAGLNFIIEQCTGLKDKNGKLIYEGDYIKSGNVIHRICWDNKNAKFVAQNKGYSCEIYQSWIDECKFEVVGNIHTGESNDNKK